MIRRIIDPREPITMSLKVTREDIKWANGPVREERA
jgi:hypothetical protein